MRVDRQLSIFLDNKPGVLAAVCRDLAEHGINIEAITVANLVDHALVRMVVSDANAAVHLIEARGVLVILSDVLAIELPDSPGAIAALAERLGRAHINIDYMYGSSRGSRAGRPTVFVRVPDVARAKRALARWIPRATSRRAPTRSIGRPRSRTPRAR